MGKTPIDKTTCHFRETPPEPGPDGQSSADEATVRTPAAPEDDLAASIREVEEKLLGPSGEAEKDPFVGTTVGPYRVSAFLGVGGMGRVYRATDTRLKRTVALKFLRVNDPESVARLLKEAQALAQLDHANVCRVYDVGEIEGKPYIAMQYIDGVSLSQQAGHLFQEQKLRLVKAVAEGLGEAHRLGLVHRDVKPGNVMLEKAASGVWKPFVMDFGLARQTGEKGVSVTGEVVGTPMYMAPEQASGRVHEVGPRTDVYALGATLYELLAGQPLWSADNPISIFACIVMEDPRPLRSIDRRIPEDLETLVMKCLEKDPAKRYADAAELAADLGRYLEGEPILARRASVVSRAWKKVRKHKAIAFVTLFSLALIVTLSVLWALSAYRMARKVELAALFDREVRYVESYMNWVKSRPLHDTRGELAFLRARLDRVRSRMDREGPVALGPGNYALGRGLLALGEYAPARDRLRRAVEEHDFRNPEVCYHLGLSLINLYDRELRRIQSMDPSERAEATARAVRDFRDPALRYLREGRAVVSESPEYLDAMLFFLEDKFPAAQAKARAGLALFPWQSAIQSLLASILIQRARLADEAGDGKTAQALVAESEALVDDLVRRRPCDLKARSQKIDLLYAHLSTALGSGDIDRATAFLALARKERTACRTIDPNVVDATEMVLMSEFTLSEFLIQRRIDPQTPIFDEGLREARWMASAAPQDATGYLYWGAFLQLQAHAILQREPSRSIALFEEASAVLRKGKAMSAERGTSFSIQLGNTFYGQSQVVHLQGGDPCPLLDEAIRAYRQAIRLSGTEALIYQNLGIVLLQKGEWLIMVRKDPTPFATEAAEMFQKAQSLRAGLEFPPLGTASAIKLNVIWKYLAGNDAARSLGELKKLSASPTLKGPVRKPVLMIYLDVLLNGVFPILSRGGDPREVLREAGEVLRQWEAAAPPSLPENPPRLYYYFTEAIAELAGSRSPDSLLEAAGEALKGLEKRGAKRYLPLLQARYHRLRGESAMLAGRDPGEDFRLANSAVENAPKNLTRDLSASLTAEAGAVLLNRALCAPNPESRRTLAAQALDRFRRAQSQYIMVDLLFSRQIRRAREITGGR